MSVIVFVLTIQCYKFLDKDNLLGKILCVLAMAMFLISFIPQFLLILFIIFTPLIPLKESIDFNSMQGSLMDSVKFSYIIFSLTLIYLLFGFLFKSWRLIGWVSVSYFLFLWIAFILL